MRDFPDFVCMPAYSCSSIHFTHFAIYRIIFGVGNFSRGFFVYSERKCSIFVSVLLSGDAHARRPLHKMDGVFLSGDAHARRPLHKMDGVFF